MKIYRFMSLREFTLLTAGCELFNVCRHNNKRTDSVGFCFLPEMVKTDYFDEGENRYVKLTFDAVECFQFLQGIVSDEVLVEFEVLDETILRECFGVYANPVSDYWEDTIAITEYSTPSYSAEQLRPVRYGMLDQWGCKCEWYELHEEV